MTTARKKSKKGLRYPVHPLLLSVLAAVVVFIVWYAQVRPDRAPVFRTEGVATVHYIDVGQGDCELIRTPNGKHILIDSGEYNQYTKVSQYLMRLGIQTIDVLVATHPHSDHIGGMSEVICDFDIGRVIMPRAESASLTYERMLTAMQERGLKAHAAVAGEQFVVDGLQFVTLAPNSEQYEELNDFSVVMRMTYGSHSFLFTGDAEGLSEREMLGSGHDLTAAFMKIGHHGSKTSTTEAFLNAVAPRVAFIGVSSDNSYGHPHEDVLNRLMDRGVAIYRTDIDGDIVVETDGERYRITTEKGE